MPKCIAIDAKTFDPTRPNAGRCQGAWNVETVISQKAAKRTKIVDVTYLKQLSSRHHDGENYRNTTNSSRQLSQQTPLIQKYFDKIIFQNKQKY